MPPSDRFSLRRRAVTFDISPVGSVEKRKTRWPDSINFTGQAIFAGLALRL
jgi:hypothetical protein